MLAEIPLLGAGVLVLTVRNSPLGEALCTAPRLRDARLEREGGVIPPRPPPLRTTWRTVADSASTVPALAMWSPMRPALGAAASDTRP